MVRSDVPEVVLILLIVHLMLKYNLNMSSRESGYLILREFFIFLINSSIKFGTLIFGPAMSLVKAKNEMTV